MDVAKLGVVYRASLSDGGHFLLSIICQRYNVGMLKNNFSVNMSPLCTPFDFHACCHVFMKYHA